METHKCKLSYSFSNGKASESHMKSHCAQSGIESASSFSSSSDEERDDKSLYYKLRDNPKKSVRLEDPEFSFARSVMLQDRESETESSKNPTQRRSKRMRKCNDYNKPRPSENSKRIRFDASWMVEAEHLSSVSDATTEEDLAFCLMMLSRDKWTKDKHSKEEEEEEEEIFLTELETDESEELVKYNKKLCKFKTRAKYKCETCKKVFRSYQALGGHRASHKKMKTQATNATVHEPEHEMESNIVAAGGSTSLGHRKVHECPVCFRVFSSGQALGGHKRSHVTGAAIATSPTLPSLRKLTKSPSTASEKLLDLNLPAPVEDEEISQIEVSAVSDAEFVHSMKP